MRIDHLATGVCGVSCRLCPAYHAKHDHCGGCKDTHRIGSNCPLLSCAINERHVEFCWECPDNATCKLWLCRQDLIERCNRVAGHQRLEENISLIRQSGIVSFENLQRIKERLLNEMLQTYDEGSSTNFYCIATTLLESTELEAVLTQAWKDALGFDVESRSTILHSILECAIGQKKRYKQFGRQREAEQLVSPESVEGIYGLNTQGGTTFVNPAAAHMLAKYRNRKTRSANTTTN